MQTDEKRREPSEFEKDLESLLNRHSEENVSNTPDFILAQFLIRCLSAWNEGTRRRDRWYAVTLSPGGNSRFDKDAVKGPGVITSGPRITGEITYLLTDPAAAPSPDFQSKRGIASGVIPGRHPGDYILIRHKESNTLYRTLPGTLFPADEFWGETGVRPDGLLKPEHWTLRRYPQEFP